MSAELTGPEDLQGEADGYSFLEQLRWGADGPELCPHCASDRGAWFLQPKDPHGRKSKGGSAARSQRRVWKCRESTCRRQFSVLTNTVMHGTKMPVRCWIDVIYALCDAPDGLSARDISDRYGIAEKSAQLMLERIQHALERPEVAGASLASNAPLWVRVTHAPVETTAQRAAAAQARRKAEAVDADAAAQVKADVARALAEALADPPAIEPTPPPVTAAPAASVGKSVKPAPAVTSEAARAPVSEEAVPEEPAAVVPEPEPIAASPVASEPEVVALEPEEVVPEEPAAVVPEPEPIAASAVTSEAARVPVSEEVVPEEPAAVVPEPEPIAASPTVVESNAPQAEAKGRPVPERRSEPRIDHDQVQSDVQRVIAELSESEGLFAEGWLDTEPDRAVDSLGPSWVGDADESTDPDDAAVDAGQLGLFDNSETDA